MEYRGLIWRKAQRSVNNGACVELTSFGGRIVVRDSKDPGGPVLLYGPKGWHAFLNATKEGKFDIPD
jgi:hypothetical protein